jgi:DNA gyrase subunit A
MTVQLEVADVPCRVYLSTTGRILRVDAGAGEGEGLDRIQPPARRSKHDAILSLLDTTSRSEIGAITDRGRLIRFSPVDLPAAPLNSVQLGAGVKVGDYLALADRKERVLAIVSLDAPRAIALGTRQGVVKRVTPGDWANKPEFEVITLKAGDAVVGAVQSADDAELVFVSSDSQLLRFSAGSVRPQGRAAGGMAGINLAADARVVFFGAVEAAEREEAVVVTVAVSDQTLPGADPGSGKVSDFAEFPAKGRATGGVRSQRFLKGETELALAWVGPAPALAVGSDGAARVLPEGGARRDGSGTPLDMVVASIGRRLA